MCLVHSLVAPRQAVPERGDLFSCFEKGTASRDANKYLVNIYMVMKPHRF